MNEYKIKYVDSKDPKYKGKLKESNHVYHYYEYTNKHQVVDKGYIWKGILWHITNWVDNTTEHPEEDVALFLDEKDEIIAWQPKVEQLVKNNLMKNLKERGIEVVEERMGYIDGRIHHLAHIDIQDGRFSESDDPGYTYWIEYKIKA